MFGKRSRQQHQVVSIRTKSPRRWRKINRFKPIFDVGMPTANAEAGDVSTFTQDHGESVVTQQTPDTLGELPAMNGHVLEETNASSKDQRY